MPARRTLFAAGAGLVVAGWTGLLRAAEQAFGPPIRDYPIVQVSPRVVIVQAEDGFPTLENQGMMSNVTFILGDKGVFCVDSGSSVQIGRMALRQLRTVTDLPVIGCLNTHYHGDHWFGNHALVEAFGADLPIYAHAEARTAMQGSHGDFWIDALASWTGGATLGTRRVYPNRDVEDGQEIDLGGVGLKFRHFGVTHTPTDIVAEVMDEGVVCGGDVIMNRRIANMDDGSFAGSLAALDAMEATGATVWLPAHGAPGPDVLDWQRRIFSWMVGHAAAAAEDWLTVEDVYAAAEADPLYGSFAAETDGWDSNIRKYLNLAFLEAEQSQL